MHIELPILLSALAATVGVLGGIITAIAYARLSRQYKDLKAQFQTLFTQESKIESPDTGPALSADPSVRDANSQLLKILEDFNSRKIPDSLTLKRALPLLGNRISPLQYNWLLQELNGYTADPGLLERLPPNLQSYRLVYADQLKMVVNDVVRAELAWPPAANRLMFVTLPLAEIEQKIADQSTEFFAAGTGIHPAGLPPNVDAVGLFHKCQFQRLTSRFRQEFSKLLCDILQL